ncbi:universal stress protein A [Leptospira kobayashii]|uniref:Universal stress protein A n=1 Tax=Leptospira kobayashii TaxID=1917830 RepID=A0ABN6KES0_9LEPT|nr:universal stress protein [Leptospira kobayashii]BDA79558.1 universal stress protein A [Leptospira kobayashii]
MYKKILMAYDGTISGKKALLESAVLGSAFHSEIKLLAVISIPSGLYLVESYVPETIVNKEEEEAKLLLEKGIQFLKEKGFHAIGELAYGEPVDQIAKAASDWKADLVVLGHAKRKGFGARWWKGSVSTSLLDLLSCSVLITISED